MAQRVPMQMDLADIVAAAWGACVRHWRLLVTVALGGAIVAALISQALLTVAPDVPAGEEVTSDQVRETLISAAPFLAIGAVAQAFTHVALIKATLGFLRAQPVSAGASLRAGLQALPAAVAVTLIVTAVAVGLAFTVILLPFALYVVVAWLLSPQAVVDEHRGPLDALRRSRQLVRGQWWRTCGVGLAVLVLALLPGLVLTAVAGGFESNIVASAGTGLATLLQAPFLAVGHTLLYLDIRRRKGEPDAQTPSPERAR